MTFNRRNVLSTALLGAGYLGLRSLATGIPTAILAKGKRAFADDSMTTCSSTAAQYTILATSGLGDPLNANAPGTYAATGNKAKIAHNQDPLMPATALSLGGTNTTAALPWATTDKGGQLTQATLDRMTVWHLATLTPVHPREPDVLSLMGATAPNEMLPSLLSRALAPCLGTIQNQPITLGATSPSEGLSFGGQALPIIPPLALKATLLNPTTGTLAGVTSLQSLRDDTLSKINDIYRRTATKAQKAYLDSVLTSQQQIRNIDQNLLDALNGITDNSVASQLTAAVVLIQMNVTPCIAVHIPFGGDNHNDTALATEALQTTSGLGSIAFLMNLLDSMSNAKGVLTDQVSFMTLNVFGRTIGPVNTDGRQHNPNHQVSVTIGKNFVAGIQGDIDIVGSDYGAIDSGEIVAATSLAQYGQTVLKGCGVSDSVLSTAMRTGSPVQSALKNV
jgi:hypothetical protein